MHEKNAVKQNYFIVIEIPEAIRCIDRGSVQLEKQRCRSRRTCFLFAFLMPRSYHTTPTNTHVKMCVAKLLKLKTKVQIILISSAYSLI